MANMLRGSLRGKLISWKDDKGFGFIQPEDGSKEIFLHISSLDSTRRPKSGDFIRYDLAPGQRGKIQAVNARIEGVPLSSPIEPTEPLSHYASPTTWVGMSAAFLFCFVSAMYHPLFGMNVIIVEAYILLNISTFIIYWFDKFAAQRKQWRTPEKTLHGLEMGGGWFGGFVAQQILRHKTIKTEYQKTFWLIVAAHVILWLLVFIISIAL
jgi:uncharacterized membrane protein YsdA (DUF1294 family)/cold shock CspA family protein